MSLTKVNYIDNATIISAKNLNDIQDNIIQNAELIKKAAPRNLLDNSDFRNPVNQRGITTVVNPEGYTIDRWRLNYGTIDVGNGNVTITTDSVDGIFDFEQNLEDFSRLQGKVCTIAIKTNYGVFAKSFVMGDLGAGMTLIDGKVNFFSIPQRHVIFRLINGAVISFEWAALYEGEYTAETLPEYQPKGYGAELAECQRYFHRYTVPAWSSLPIGKNEGGDILQFKTQLNFPPLRTTFPSVTVSCPGNLQIIYVDGSTSPLFTADDIVSCTSYSVGYNTRLELRGIAVLTEWKFGALTAQEHYFYIDFSSDL